MKLCANCGNEIGLAPVSYRYCKCGCKMLFAVCRSCGSSMNRGEDWHGCQKSRTELLDIPFYLVFNGIINPIGMSKQFCEA